MSAAPAPFYVAEPPAAFSMRPPIVVDCSALSAILFDEPARDEALARLIGRSLHAPQLLDHEIVSVALKKRRKDGPVEAIAQALRDYANSDIDLHPAYGVGGHMRGALGHLGCVVVHRGWALPRRELDSVMDLAAVAPRING